MVHALRTLRPDSDLLDTPFDLHTDNHDASLQRLQQQPHLSHHHASWLNLLAEYNVVHILAGPTPRIS